MALTVNLVLGAFALFNPFTPMGFAIGALVAGALFGLIVSLPQSIALRRGAKEALRWIIFTTLGFAMALFVGNSMLKILPALESPIGYVIQGILMGFWIGLAHWLATGPYWNRPVLWATVSGAAWAVALVTGGIIGSLALIGGGLVYGVTTAYPFVMLSSDRQPTRIETGSA